MARISIKKGHDIRIVGKPIPEIQPSKSVRTVALHPNEFRYVKPRLLVKTGDQVKIGTPLFFDKKAPTVKWSSPGSGKIAAIHFGHRRVLEKIVIELDKNEEHESFKKFDHKEITKLSRDEVAGQILQAGLWPLIRQRPFNKIANPGAIPAAIFISCYNSAPLAVDLDLALRNRKPIFQAGVSALAKLTHGPVNIIVNDQAVSDTFNNIEHAVTHSISGPHPAGNVGIQIHHIDPLKPKKVIWTVEAQFVVTLGNLFLKGQFDPQIVVTVGGPSAVNPVHLESRIGSDLQSITEGHIVAKPARIISGDVLTGIEKDAQDHLGFYHTSVAIVPHADEREFMGMLKLGSYATRYSLTNTFMSLKKTNFRFSTRKNGEERAMIPINTWENVLPMDIYPNALYRAILAGDIEEMEQLGLIECDEEDFALCSFADPSKIDVGAVIRKGLDMLEKETL